MSVLGYARVSNREQSGADQVELLHAAGATSVFLENEASRHRPEWNRCLEEIKDGDLLLVCSVDRIAPTQALVIETLQQLSDRRIRLKSLHEPFFDLDRSTPQGAAIASVIATLNNLRKVTHRDNTVRGLATARARGRVGGRPSVMTPERQAKAAALRERGMSLRRIASELGVGTSTVARALGVIQVASTLSTASGGRRHKDTPTA